jgi:hypothetical protein
MADPMLIDCFKPILTERQKAKLFMLLSALDRAMADRPWMLYGGSLLGHILWGDLLPWDDDIDVVTTMSPAELDVRPFSSLRIDYGVNPLVKVFDPRDARVPMADHSFPFIDVSMFHDSNRFVIHPSTHGGIDRFPRELIFPLRRVRFGVCHAIVPHDPIRLLKIKYGPDCFTSARTPYWDHRYEQFTHFPNERLSLDAIVKHYGYPASRPIG